MKYYKILGRETCPWCCKACEVLKDESLDFMFCEMEHSPDLIDYWKEEYNMTTVPIVVEVDADLKAEHLIGGCTDLIKYLGVTDEESD